MIPPCSCITILYLQHGRWDVRQYDILFLHYYFYHILSPGTPMRTPTMTTVVTDRLTVRLHNLQTARAVLQYYVLRGEVPYDAFKGTCIQYTVCVCHDTGR